jgi:TPR repeat protein
MGGAGGLRPSPSTSSNVSVKRRPTEQRPSISKASIDEYRTRIKAERDPEAQFNFAKYLIEAARTLAKSPAATGGGDEAKVLKKYRDALLQESLKLIKRLATQAMGPNKPPYADAQFFLANCLGNGSLGLQVDHEKAYNLYVQASKQNHAAATYRTAVCNEVGAGTRRDHTRAVLFYRKASALGDTAGMYKLGMILLHGSLGEQRNPKEAIVWLTRAASQADDEFPHALHELGLLYEKPGLAGGCLPCDESQARELFTQAAQLNYSPSQHRLGACYEFGSLTCPVDPRRSIAWYSRAAERENAESELALSGW